MTTEDRLRAAQVDTRIDDLTRARIWARLEPEVRSPAAPAPAPAATRRPAGGRARRAGDGRAAAAALWLAWPRPRTAAVLGGDVVSVGADSQLTAQLDDRTTATLIGPAAMVVRQDAPGRLDVRLDRGTFVGEMTPGRDRQRLIIHSPGARTEIVGTRFTVTVTGPADSCVAVQHGRVRVTAVRDDATVLVGAGEAWCSDGRIAAPRRAPRRRRRPRRPRRPLIAPRRSRRRRSRRRRSRRQRHLRPARTAPSPSPSPAPPTAPDPALADTATVADALARHDAAATSAEDAYERAEAAMATGDAADADAWLARLIAAHPDHALAVDARLERARLALARGDDAAARAHLAPLIPASAAAHYLSCRVAVRDDDVDADACVASFLRAHPTSPRRREAVEWSARRAHQRGGCDAARPWIDELATIAPAWPATRSWQAACPTEAP
ncbi:MAG: FecR domain-containing protein [Kofleriaceae bacterium]|nr:FecR domain-containing protein [Kofleriaceae bacterium]